MPLQYKDPGEKTLFKFAAPLLYFHDDWTRCWALFVLLALAGDASRLAALFWNAVFLWPYAWSLR